MTARLAHVCIETSDLEATERFYAALGLRRQFEFRNKQNALVGFYLKFDDQSYIEVIKTSAPKGDGIVRHFAIEVDDVDAVGSRLVSSGYEHTDKVRAGDCNWMITCTDPNGIFIEVQQYTDESLQLAGGVCEVDYEP